MQLNRYFYNTFWCFKVCQRTWMPHDNGKRYYRLRFNGEETPLFDGKGVTREEFERKIDALVPSGGEVDEYFRYLYGTIPGHPKEGFELIASYRAEV